MLNLLFPRNCFECERLGSWLCKKCFEEVTWCENTKRLLIHPSITEVCSVVEYRDSIEKLLSLVKQSLYSSFIELWAQLTVIAYPRLFNQDTDIFVPMPTTRSRLWERGFSPVNIYARHLSRLTKVPVCENLLARTKEGGHLSQKNKEERKQTDHGFVLLRSPPDKNIWLLDDVITTGATVNHCAKLFAAQGKTIKVLTFAQTP